MTGERIEVSEAQDAGVGVREPPLDDHAAWIGRLDRVDGALGSGDEDSEARILINPQRKRKVLRREGLAVLPGEAATQGVGGLHAAIRKHAPRARVELGKRFGKVWPRCSDGVEHDQSGVEQAGRVDWAAAALDLG